MARAASKPKKEISMEEALWKSADKLRGSVEPAEYKHVVLSLFFLKFASDKFEAQRKAISEKYGEKFVDNVAFYTKDNVFFLPEISRWSFIMENAKQDDIALKIDTALYTIVMRKPETSCFGLKNSKMKMASYQLEKTQCTPWSQKLPLCH